jgi:hypothetical protein
LFRLIDQAALAAAFGQFLDVLGEDGAGVVARSTARRCSDRSAGRRALHGVTAFAVEAQLVNAQKAMPVGGNEITSAREMLQRLDLKGMRVTTDAIRGQHGTAALVLERGGD